jgi:hypothetical protein
MKLGAESRTVRVWFLEVRESANDARDCSDVPTLCWKEGHSGRREGYLILSTIALGGLALRYNTPAMRFVTQLLCS